MVFDVTTSLGTDQVFAQAKRFFAERVPNQSAFPEKEGAEFLVLRGQGGEEIAIAAVTVEGTTRVRASTLFFDQVVDRFLGTLPPAGSAA